MNAKFKTLRTGQRVLVHELERGDKYRYFVSVDGRISPATQLALELGTGLWTRKDALNKADILNRRLAVHATAIAAAAEAAAQFPTSTNQYTLRRQEEALRELLSHYPHSFPAANV